MAHRTTKAGEQVPRGERPPAFVAFPGVRDLLPRERDAWLAVEDAVRGVADLHQCFPIDPAPLERASVYQTAFGTEVLPYLSKVAGERVVPLLDPRVAVLRAVLEHHVGGAAVPLKLWYASSLVGTKVLGARDCRAIRVRGFEFIGEGDPVYDGETIAAALDVLRMIRIGAVKLTVNTLGCRVCRGSYQQKLAAYYRGHRAKLCHACGDRLEGNPLALLGCAVHDCRELRAGAPILLDYLCQNCNNHFRSVLEFVEEIGALYEPSPYLVGPASYHTRTVFEISLVPPAGTPGDTVPTVVAAGGRYDYLAEKLQGKSVPAVGVTLYPERCIDAIRASSSMPSPRQKPAVFFIAIGDHARRASLGLMQQLRAGGVPVAESVGKKSFQTQLKVAEKLQTATMLIVGQREVFEGTVIVRDLGTGAQETVLAANLAAEVKRRLRV